MGTGTDREANKGSQIHKHRPVSSTERNAGGKQARRREAVAGKGTTTKQGGRYVSACMSEILSRVAARLQHTSPATAQR